MVAAVDAALQAAGALSVSLSDPGGRPVLEPEPGATPLWEDVIVTALFPADAGREELEQQVQAALGAAHAGAVFSILEERDWVREFRENLRPLAFGRLWICPAGTGCPEPGGISIQLEPGLAFGSGAHPTTAMCLEWLAGLDLRGRRVLDWGCGSGVLAIAALALGAESVTAVDIDPQALQATADNAAANGLNDSLEILDPEDMRSGERYDVVVANILADSLIALAPRLRQHCQAGAHVALSGILGPQAGRVRAACTPWLSLRRAGETGGWVLLSGAPA